MFHQETCPRVEQEDMSSCSTRKHVILLGRRTCVLVEQENNLRGIWETIWVSFMQQQFRTRRGGSTPPAAAASARPGGVDLGTPQAHLPGGQPPPRTSGDMILAGSGYSQVKSTAHSHSIRVGDATMRGRKHADGGSTTSWILAR